jgi:D-glycero-D-manno-heptose 1,7-bisphosphate phosphatase
MSRCAIFLDRDGTINVDKGYVHSVNDFEYLPGAVDGLRMLQSAGYLLVIVTNQSGIARGYFTEQDFQTLTKWMSADLTKLGVSIDGVYHCPHYPNITGPCSCRKPKLGLFEQAIKELDISLSGSWAVGDNVRDISICDTTPCKGILISHEERHGKYLHAASLLDAACLITEANS